jgi:hypothetical protein
MKKFIIFSFFLLFLCLDGFSQILFTGSNTSDGGIIYAGRNSIPGRDWDFWLQKTDKFGDVQWTKNYGGLWQDFGYFAQHTPDNGYIMTGRSTSWTGVESDALVIKVDSVGNQLWLKTYGTFGADTAFYACPLSTGGYVVTGTMNETNCFAVKIRDGGDTVWQRVLGAGKGIFACEDSQHQIVIGAMDNSGIGQVYFLGQDGTKTKTVSLSRYTNIMMTSFNNGYILAGNLQLDSTTRGFGMARIDSNANVRWEKLYGAGKAQFLNVTPDGNALASWSSGDTNKFVKASAATGDSAWTITGILGTNPMIFQLPNLGYMVHSYICKKVFIYTTCSDNYYYYTNQGIKDSSTLITVTRLPSASTKSCVVKHDTTLSITIACPTTGADLRYTLDGSVPTQSSLQYSAPLQISSTTTLSAVAFATGLSPSAMMRNYYYFDSSIPVVVGTSPVKDTIGASVIKLLEVRLSEPVKASSVSRASFIVRDAGGALVNGQVKYLLGANTVRFIPFTRPEYPVSADWTPCRYLKYGTRYTCTVSGLTDTVGNVMSPYTWQFTTGSATDDRKNCLAKYTNTYRISLSGSTNFTTYVDTNWITYDSGNRVTKIRNFNAESPSYSTVAYEYGNFGATKRTNLNGKDSVTGYATLQYDSNGHVSIERRYDASGLYNYHITYYYDSLGREKIDSGFRADSSFGSIAATSYGSHGGITSISWGAGLGETRSYDAEYNVTGITQGSNSWSYVYDDFCRVLHSSSRDFHYDGTGKVDLVRNFVYGYTNWLTYSYNAAGNEISRAESAFRNGDFYSYLVNDVVGIKQAVTATKRLDARVEYIRPRGVIKMMVAGSLPNTPLILQVYNLAGRLLFHTKDLHSRIHPDHSIFLVPGVDIPHLPFGLLICKVSCNHQSISSKIMISSRAAF